MKTKLLVYLLLFLIPRFTFGQMKEDKVKALIAVSTAEEFIQAIGSDRTLILPADTFFLRDIGKLRALDLEAEGTLVITDHVKYIAGNGIVIHGVSNLTLSGTINNKNHSILSTRDKGDIVLTFRKCGNIVIENLEANHLPKTEGSCQGGVLFLDSCQDIHVSNCTLVGSGAFGIQCDDVDNLDCEKTKILECSSLLFEWNRSHHLVFHDCSFSEIRCSGYLSIISDCRFASFTNCSFSNNAQEGSYSPDQKSNYLFYFYDDTKSSDFLMDHCHFSNNKLKSFTNKKELFVKKELSYENNDNLK